MICWSLASPPAGWDEREGLVLMLMKSKQACASSSLLLLLLLQRSTADSDCSDDDDEEEEERQRWGKDPAERSSLVSPLALFCHCLLIVSVAIGHASWARGCRSGS